MVTRHSFIRSNPAHLSVANHTEPPEKSVIGKAWGTVSSSRVAKSIVSVFTAAMIIVAIVTIGNPIALLVTSSQVGTSVAADINRQSMPAIQSSASAQALPPTASASAQALPPAAVEPPRGGELLAAFKTAFESKTEVDQPKADALFNQFQAWAAAEDVPLQVRPLAAHSRCPGAGRAKIPSAALAKASTDPNRTLTGPISAKCSVAHATPRLAQLNVATLCGTPPDRAKKSPDRSKGGASWVGKRRIETPQTAPRQR